MIDVSDDLKLVQSYLITARTSLKQRELVEMAAKKLEHIAKVLRCSNG